MAVKLQRGDQYVCGGWTGTGAALQVPCGFIPQMIIGVNITQTALIFWSKDLNAGTSAAYGWYAKNGSAFAQITSAGITVSADNSTFKGFTVGTNANFNTNADVVVFIAFE